MVGGSPFFTTFPSGRVGSAHDSVYSSNDEFKQVWFQFVRILYSLLLYFSLLLLPSARVALCVDPRFTGLMLDVFPFLF